MCPCHTNYHKLHVFLKTFNQNANFFVFLHYIYCLDSECFEAMNTTGKLDGSRTKDIFSHR